MLFRSGAEGADDLVRADELSRREGHWGRAEDTPAAFYDDPVMNL